jgi:hypothetical protein
MNYIVKKNKKKKNLSLILQAVTENILIVATFLGV